MKYLKYYNSIMDYLTDTRLYHAVSMIYEKDDSSKFQPSSYIFNHIINVSDLPYTMFPYFDINSVSSVLSNNENEGISTLSLNDLETIKIIVEEDS